MTNYRANIQAQSNSFLDITQSQLYVVVPNATTNKVENPSFETPTYDGGPGGGGLLQYNWDYSLAPYPVTFHHAFSGSFAWKAKMSINTAEIAYGKTRAIQPTTVFERHDILSFYCYCIEDASSDSYQASDYGAPVESHEHDFIVSIYGVNEFNVKLSGATGTIVGQHTFSLTSIPKTQLGDLQQGLSGSKLPYFYPWQRIVYKIPFSVRSYKYFYFTIKRVNSNPLSPIGRPLYDTYFVIDAVQVEDQPITKSATMYFDGSYESFNSIKYPYDFQWTGNPYQSMSIRSANTRVNGELVDFNEYCGFYIKDISGLSIPSRETQVFPRTLADGQYFVSQTIRNEPIVISGRIIASSESLFMQSFNRFQELIGKKPFAQPEPVRMFFHLKFTDGTELLPVYADVAYRSGLEQDTANVFQQDMEISFDTVSTYLQYQNDSSTNMFNDNPLYDQFNTMNVDILRDIGGLVYYNKAEEKWEIPSNIGFFRATDNQYTSLMSYGGTGVKQTYDTKTQYTVGDVHVIKEDGDGIIWFGGSFDIVEIDAYYINDSNERVDTRLQIQANNIVGLRRRAMSGTAFVLPEILSVTYPENGPTLNTVEYVSDWQVIVLLDAPTRYSMSREQNPPAFVGINRSFGNVVIRAIEFTPNGTMYIGGSFNFQYGGRRFINIAAFRPYGSDAQNITLYKPDSTYGWISVNFNATSLLSNRGRGVHRTNWVNSALPYCKYGIFEDVGRVGSFSSSQNHVVHDIVYDALNECLYIGGEFTEVANPYSAYNTITAYRIVKYHIPSSTYVAINQDSVVSGINPASTSPSSSIVVRKILVQYTPSGSRLLAVGTFTAVGKSTSTLTSFGIAIIDSPTLNPNAFIYRDTGGGGFKNATPAESANFYDAIITKSNRVFIAGDFNRLNKSFLPPTVVTGIAEYRYGNFTDITRGMEASYYDDTYEEIPAVRSMSANSSNEIYFVGNFTNIKNREMFDGIAKWDGEEFYGVGMYFLPALSKVLQKVFVDSADNVYVFTGPNNQQTTVLRTLLADPISYVPPAGVEVAWMNFAYPALQSIFKAENLQIEFYSKEVVANKTTFISGIVNAVCVVGNRTGAVHGFANKDTVFIGGKFDYVKIGDTEFRVNNLVALRFDEFQNPFPIRVLAFSNGRTPYYDNGSLGEDKPFIGVGFRDRQGVTNSQIYSIDVVTKQQTSGQYVPVEVYVGGRFDFDGLGYEGASDTIKGSRFKNFFAIELQLNSDKSDIQFNIPENNELNISVPYINYAAYRAPGPAGTYGRNDAVFTVKASSGTFNNGVTRTDPELVFFGGSFTEVTSVGTTMPARRVGVYSRTNSYVAQSRRYYKIDLTNNTTPAGAAVNTSFDAGVRVAALEYTPWRTTVSPTTFLSTLVVGGNYTNSVGSPFSSGGTSITTGADIVRVGIVATGKPTPLPKTVASFTTNGTLNYINDFAFDTVDTVYAVGDFTEPGSQRNVTKIIGSTSTDSVSTSQIAIGTWGYVYDSSLGLPFNPKYIMRHPVTGALVISGTNTNEIFQPYTDSTAIIYNNFLAFFGANYAYSNANIPQVNFETTGTVSTITQPPRRLTQASTVNVGRPINLMQSSVNNTMSVPYQSYVNSLYDAVPLQTFNCYNNGTASAFPTITLYCPFKGDSLIYSFIHVITNVTTKQSLYLNYTMKPNEVIRIRTDRERISAISNYSGDITNILLSSKSVTQLNIASSELFRLVPGKNVIRYGPLFPMQRYFATGFKLSGLVYNLNRNSIAPPIVVALSWNIAFNSIYDAIPTDVNPMIL
jgi:hypothetical protein